MRALLLLPKRDFFDIKATRGVRRRGQVGYHALHMTLRYGRMGKKALVSAVVVVVVVIEDMIVPKHRGLYSYPYPPITHHKTIFFFFLLLDGL